MSGCLIRSLREAIWVHPQCGDTGHIRPVVFFSVSMYVV